MDEKLHVATIVERVGAVLTAALVASVVYLAVMTAFGMMLDLYLSESGAYFTLSSIVSVIAGYVLLRAMMTASGVPIGSASFASYFGLSIIIGIGTIVGLIVLIVPGIIVAVRWLPAYVLLLTGESRATEAPGASWDLTEGQFWPLLCVLLIGVAPLFLGGAVVGILQADLDPAFAFEPWQIALTMAMNVLIAAFALFTTALGVATYMMLRPQSAGMAEVFA